MLTSLDDHLGHQTPGTFAQAGGGDPRFTERYWFTAHPADGSALLLDLGLGYYPNRGVMDGFAGFTIGRKQHNFRCSRRLGANPLDSRVGPLAIEVLAGGQRFRLTLGANPSGISFDVVFEGRFPAAQEKQSFRERKGVVEEDLARVTQMGRYTGWIEADGQRHTVTPETWWGQRDRSWGIRSEMRTDADKPPVQTHANFFWTWSMFQCDDLGVSIFMKEREPGRPYYLSGIEFTRDAQGRVQHREAVRALHDIEWADDPLGQTIARATLTLEFEQGAPRVLQLEGTGTRFYLKGGLYGGFGGWNHGDDRGEYHEGHDVWDLDDAATRARARTLGDHVMRVRSDGRQGWGIAEYGVAAGFPKYPGPQIHPAL